MTLTRMTRIVLTAGLLAMGTCFAAPHAAMAAPAHSHAISTIQLPAGPGPLDNPLKGWCTYTEAGQIRQPYSLVYFYVPWKAIEPRPGDYQFAAWEKKVWDTPPARGKHIVFRIYLDYPGTPSGIPDWLLAQGLKTHHYTDYGGGESPNYDDPHLVSGLERLIAAMGRRYDNNPRVAFIALGLLGYWGEWHTYPHMNLFAGEQTQKRVIDAYRRAFPHKILVGRYAKGYMGRQPWIGFHDDMFPSDSDGTEDWKFLQMMRTSGRTENWKRGVIGAEMEPGHANQWMESGYSTTLSAIEKGHFSWIGPYSPAIAPNQTPQLTANSQAMVRRMGYEFELRDLRYTPKVISGGKLKFDLSGENRGVAPFYYPWPVRIALLTDDHRVAQILPVRVDIRSWQPGAFHLSDSLPVNAKAGSYQLALGIIDPYTGAPAIRFANNLLTVGDWSILGRVEVGR